MLLFCATRGRVDRTGRWITSKKPAKSIRWWSSWERSRPTLPLPIATRTRPMKMDPSRSPISPPCWRSAVSSNCRPCKLRTWVHVRFSLSTFQFACLTPLLECRQKTVKSTAELEVELNQNFAFDAITEAGEDLQPVSGPGLQGLQNLGNSC